MRAAWLLMAVAVLAAVVRVGLPGDGASPEADAGVRRGAPPSADAGLDAGPTVAVVMVDRLQLFRTGNAGSRMELDGRQLTALVRHAVPGVIPAGVSSPSVQIVDGRVWVHAKVSPTLVPGGRYLTESLDALPESVEVELRGRLETEHPSSIVYYVDDVLVQGVAFPRAVAALVIGAIQAGEASAGPTPTQTPAGVRAAGEGAGSAPVLRMRWPADAGILRVVSDRVVLERAEPLLEQSVDGSGGA